MLLVAVFTWLPILQAHPAELWFRGDARGVLHGVLQRRARNPWLKLIIAESQLVLACSDHTITAEHLWSEQKDICDDLSRQDEGIALPAAVRGANRWEMVRGPYKLLACKDSLWDESQC